MPLSDELKANTAKRLANMDRDDYDAIDRGIEELIAANAGSGAPGAGDTAPSFTLPDATGVPRSLAEYLAKGPVVIGTVEIHREFNTAPAA